MRSFHDFAFRVPRGQHLVPKQHSRALHIQEHQARTLLFERSPTFPISRSPIPPQEVECAFSITLTIDRTSGAPCFFVSSPTSDLTGFALDYSHATPPPEITATIVEHVQLPEKAKEKVSDLLAVLWRVFKENEAYTLQLRNVVVDHEGRMIVAGSGEDINGRRGMEFVFDDAAFRSSGRQQELHALRDFRSEVVEETEAGRAGISYVKLAGDDANIGTIGTSYFRLVWTKMANRIPRMQSMEQDSA